VSPRWTSQTAAVVVQLLSENGQWGRQLAQVTRLKTGTVHPILMRLEQEGLAFSEWERDVPQGRPRRRYYTLTAEGRLWASEHLAKCPAGTLDGIYPWVTT
jgi:DNA-binding PadR family transcriptional regulator